MIAIAREDFSDYISVDAGDIQLQYYNLQWYRWCRPPIAHCLLADAGRPEGQGLLMQLKDGFKACGWWFSIPLEAT